MQGAREYAVLFESGQYGRLYIASGSHARGRTFRIFVLPEGAVTTEKNNWNAPRVPDIVEVFGIVSGQPGWTETYGWLHKGPWVDDFMALVEKRREQIAWEKEQREAMQSRQEAERVAREAALLATYHSTTDSSEEVA